MFVDLALVVDRSDNDLATLHNRDDREQVSAFVFDQVVGLETYSESIVDYLTSAINLPT